MVWEKAVAEGRRVQVERGALAAYLDDLEWDTLHLPDGWPSASRGAESRSRAPVAPGRGAVGGAGTPTPGSRAPRSGRSDSRAAVGTSGAVDASPGDPSTTERTEAYRVDIPAALSAERRAELFQAAHDHALGCRACTLCEKRNKVVFGDGDRRASLMLVGEGPGAAEDREGLPFVGPAGELLTKMLAAIEIDRQAAYIANVVKCRPPGNRDPKPEEVAACSGYLEAQVRLIRPRLILALGRVAAQSLLVTTESLGRLRGRWHEYAGVPVWVTYHPAALLRNASYKRPTWEDLQLVRDRLAEFEASPDA